MHTLQRCNTRFLYKGHIHTQSYIYEHIAANVFVNSFEAKQETHRKQIPDCGI